MSKIIVIVGPTAVGKTKLSIELAKHLDAEIINADAVQIYKEANIATAKIKEEEMEGIKHHLLSIKSLNDNYTVYDYQKDARKILDELIKENKNVIIVGGSGLYLKSLLYDYQFSEENKDIETFDNFKNEELKKQIDKIYPSNQIHQNNRKRLIRFLNHYNKTGKFITNKEEKDKPIYTFKTIGLVTDKETLYNLINLRVDTMFKEGLLAEALELYKKGYSRLNSIIGYKELNKYFNKTISLEEAVEEIKENTRKYSKRQLTWFRNQMKEINWFNADLNEFENTIKEVEESLK